MNLDGALKYKIKASSEAFFMELRFIRHLVSVRLYWYIGIITLVFSANSIAQKDSSMLVIEIVDRSDLEPVPNVIALIQFVNGKGCYKQSNHIGKLSLWTKRNEELKIKLNHPLYNSQEIQLTVHPPEEGDTLFVNIKMELSRLRTLKDVVVKPPGKPDTVFESKRLSVADFELLPDGRLLLLAYPKQLKKGSEMLLYDGVEVQGSFTVPGTAEELVRDFRGNAHVVCKENVFGITVSGNDVAIATLEKDFFLKYVAPILDTSHTKYFLSNFNAYYPAFNYYAFDQTDSTYLDLLHIEDELMMELYRSEYKWVDVRTKLWAKNKEHETGIDAEIWVGANYFTQSIYYKELYAPLFLKNDTIYVFDYYRDQLFSFDVSGNKLDSIGIYHHYHAKSTGWQKQLIQDRVTGEIYALFENGGFSYLGRINLKSGEIIEKVQLEFKFVEKIAVHDNFVYYVYRPYESPQRKFLYKERLPYLSVGAGVPQGRDTLTETGK